MFYFLDSTEPYNFLTDKLKMDEQDTIDACLGLIAAFLKDDPKKTVSLLEKFEEAGLFSHLQVITYFIYFYYFIILLFYFIILFFILFIILFFIFNFFFGTEPFEISGKQKNLQPPLHIPNAKIPKTNRTKKHKFF